MMELDDLANELRAKFEKTVAQLNQMKVEEPVEEDAKGVEVHRHSLDISIVL